MAAHGSTPVTRSDIADLLGTREPGDLSVVRANLIAKGIIIPTGHGQLDFTIPGFDQWIRDRAQPDTPTRPRRPQRPPSHHGPE